MNCYLHTDAAAVGICKTCNRGICVLCVHEGDLFVACSDACVKEATATQRMTRMAHSMYGIGVEKKRIPIVTITWAGFGILFMGWALYLYLSKDVTDWFLIGFGSFAFVIAWMSFRRAKETGLNC